jgi:ribosome biogenesis GTPase / thiamine phosphate phosphatase
MSTSDYLALLGADETTISACETAGDLVPGRVTRAEHSLVTVLTPAGQLRAALGHTELPCSGDWVLINVADPSSPAVARVLPRRTALVRHATGNQSVPQTLAANMDDVFVTVAADRDVSLGRIERFLTLVWESGASPVVVLTKSDLLPPDAGAPLMTAAMNVAPGAEVYLVSVVTGDGIDELSVRLRPNRTAALIGSSGAGKSSLLNAMAGADVAATSDVRDVDGKGKHKTAWRELVLLESGGAVIDTPGLRGLGVWLDQGGLDATFADVAELAAQCRFSDCRHESEPDCAVLAAISSGELEARRLESYRKLEREAAYVARKTDVRARREATRAWVAKVKQTAGHTRQPGRYS